MVPDVSLIFSPSQTVKQVNSSISATLASSMNTRMMNYNMDMVNGKGLPDQRIYSAPPETNLSSNSDPRRQVVSQNNSPHTLNNSDPKIYSNNSTQNNSPHALNNSDPKINSNSQNGSPQTMNNSNPRMYPNSQKSSPHSHSTRNSQDNFSPRINPVPQVQNTPSPISCASNNNNSRDSGMTLSPCSPQPDSISTKLLQELIEMVRRQGITIERMDQQLQTLAAAQEKESESSGRKSVDQEVQTEPEAKNTDFQVSTPTTSNSKDKPDTRRNSKPGSDSSSSSSSSRRRSNSPKASTRHNGGPIGNGRGHTRERIPVPMTNERNCQVLAPLKPITSTSVEESMKDEDYSTCLRGLRFQLANIQESMCSAENSIRSIDFDGIDNRYVRLRLYSHSIMFFNLSRV